MNRSIGDWGKVAIAGFFLLFPLIVLPNTITNFIWSEGKIILLVLIALLFALMTRFKGLTPLFAILLSAQLLFFALSCFMSGSGIYFSFFGVNGRDDGLFYQTFLFIFSLGLFSYASRKSDVIIETIYKASILVLFIQILLVVLKVFNLDVVAIYAHGETAKFNDYTGTIGNYGALSYLIMIFYCLYISRYLQYKSRFDLFLIIIAILFIGFLSNRTTFAAVILINLLLLVKYRWIMIPLALSALLFVWTPLGGLKVFKSTNGALERTVKSSATLKYRLTYWALAADVFQKTPLQPWLGLGNDGFTLGQVRYGDTNAIVRAQLEEDGIKGKITKVQKLPSSSKIETLSSLVVTTQAEDKKTNILYSYLIDKVHNNYLDMIMRGGVIYMIINVLILVLPLLKIIKQKDFVSNSASLAIISTLAYYVFWFPFSSVEPLFYVFVVLAWARAYPISPLVDLHKSK